MLSLRIAVFIGGMVFTGSALAAPSLGDLSAQWASDWSAKKLDAVMKLYAPDPVFLPSSHERWTGTAEVRNNFAALLAQFNPDVHLHSLVSEASGYLAYDSGSYEETVTPVKGGAAMQFKGDYLFLFQRVHGEWKILEQTWT